MNKFFLALALLVFGGAAAQAQPQTGAAQYLEDQPRVTEERGTHAPPPGAVRVRQQPVRARAPEPSNPYRGYWYGARSPQELAGIIARSLRSDRTGRTMLSAERCRQNGSCAAPINYVESMRAHDPYGNWTLDNLVEKMERLVLRCNLTGVYQMDRIIYTGGRLGRTDVSGMSRSFDREGGCAWVNPDTGAPVLAPDCANPVGQRIDIDCVVIILETRIAEEQIVDWQRRRSATDQCFAYRRVARPYESQFTGPTWIPIRAGRIGNDDCSFCDYNRTFGYRPVSEGSIPLERGFTQIRIARNEPIDWCLKSWDWGSVRSSFTNGINWPDGYSLVGREHFARIYYSSAEMEAAGFRLGQPKARFWWAVNAADEARIRASYGR